MVQPQQNCFPMEPYGVLWELQTAWRKGQHAKHVETLQMDQPKHLTNYVRSCKVVSVCKTHCMQAGFKYVQLTCVSGKTTCISSYPYYLSLSVSLNISKQQGTQSLETHTATTINSGPSSIYQWYEQKESAALGKTASIPPFVGRKSVGPAFVMAFSQRPVHGWMDGCS